MADEGITIYYCFNEFFNFQKTCNYLERMGLHNRHPQTQLIMGSSAKEYKLEYNFNDFAETNQEKVQEIIYSAKYSGISLWLDSGHRVRWSFSQQDNYFLENFGISHLEDTEIEKISKFFIKFALQELTEVEQGFLGFTLDQFGSTDAYDFGEIFENGNKETLSPFYISDITFLPKDKMNRVALDNESEVIRLNQSFDCK
jgi:hypothetical protein